MLLDTSLKTREPEYFTHLMTQIGNDSVRTTRNHAKWVTIRNDVWNLVIRGSMNFGAAPRLEFFEVSDSPDLADFLDAIADELFERAPVWNFEGDGDGVQFVQPATAAAGDAAQTASAESGRLTVDQVAEYLHMSRNLVTRMRNAGQITFDDDGCTTLARAKDEVRTAGRGGSVTAARTQIDPDDDRAFDGYVDIVEAKRRETVAKAEKAEIEVAKLRGELIPVSRALAVYADVATKIKVNVESIPNRCAELLVGQTDPAAVRRILESEIERALAAVTEGAPHVDV